jgi:hypothetical protein
MRHFTTKELSARPVQIYRPRMIGFDPEGLGPILEGEGRIETHENKVRYLPTISRRAAFGALAGLGAFAFALKDEAKANTQFLWGPGTSNNGLLTSAISLLTTEMNALANTNTALSSVGGSSGVFTNSNTAQGMIGRCFLTLGAIASALSAGAVASIWWIPSYNGSTFESTASNAAQARAPDCVIPLPATTISGASVYASPPSFVEALEFYVFLQNNTGQTFAATANTLRLAPFSMQY